MSVNQPENHKRRYPARFQPPRRGLGLKQWQDTLHSFVPDSTSRPPSLTVQEINRLLAEAAEEDRTALKVKMGKTERETHEQRGLARD